MEKKEEKLFPNNIRNHIKELLGENKKLSKIFKDEYLKEEIERYLDSTRLQLILVSGTYSNDKETSSRENFTLDMIRAIFGDDNIIYEDENVVLSLGFLIRELNTKYNEITDFYLPIEEYRKLSIRAEEAYKEAYNKNGVKGLQTVYNGFDMLIDENVNRDNLNKITNSTSIQRDLINIIILNKRGLPLSECPENTEENLNTQISNAFKKEEKNNTYKRRYN